MSSIDEQKVDLIKNYPIPNTKEDIMEFIFLASSNIDMKVYGMDGARNQAQRELSDAWVAKFDQAYQKASIILASDSLETVRLHELYRKKKKQIIWAKCSYFLILIGFAIFMLLFIYVSTNIL